MSKDLNEIKEKLRKLISKEESARTLGNLAEAETFAAKIQELLLKYALDMEELKEKNSTSEINAEKVDLTDMLSPHEADWVYLLYSVGAKNNFCTAVFPARMSYPHITIIGEEMYREFTHYFVHQLVSKIRELSRRSFKEYRGPDKRNTYIRSFLRGAVMGIATKLDAARKAAEAAQPQVSGLVVRKDQAVKQWMAENYGPTGTRKARSSSSADGYSAGYAAGQGLDINKGVGSKAGGPKLLK